MQTDVDAHPVAWREAGRGPVALFLHGLGGSRPSWDPQLTGLADVRRCISWDMPGYGASAPVQPLAFHVLVEAVDALLDRLGVADVDLVGSSLGGMIALHYAAAHPGRVRSLAVLSTSPAFGFDQELGAHWRQRRLAPLDAGATPADLAEDVLRGLAGRHAPEAAIADSVTAMSRIPAAGLRAAIDCLITHDIREALPGIDVPTLVLVGDEDEETPSSYARYIAQAMPQARLTVVPHAGHLLSAERPDEVNAALRVIWSECGPPSAAAAARLSATLKEAR